MRGDNPIILPIPTRPNARYRVVARYEDVRVKGPIHELYKGLNGFHTITKGWSVTFVSHEIYSGSTELEWIPSQVETINESESLPGDYVGYEEHKRIQELRQAAKIQSFTQRQFERGMSARQLLDHRSKQARIIEEARKGKNGAFVPCDYKTLEERMMANMIEKGQVVELPVPEFLGQICKVNNPTNEIIWGDGWANIEPRRLVSFVAQRGDEPATVGGRMRLEWVRRDDVLANLGNKPSVYANKPPWANEPDYEFWWYRGIPCFVTRHKCAGTLNGYIQIPPDHPGNEESITVHGDITFSDTLEGVWNEEQVPKELLKKHWIGFDCEHYQDLKPYYDGYQNPKTEYRTFAYVVWQVKSMVDQVLETDDTQSCRKPIKDSFKGIDRTKYNFGNRTPRESVVNGRPVSKLHDILEYSPHLVFYCQNDEDPI